MSHEFHAAFEDSVKDTLLAFTNTACQCVAVCAAVSWHLTKHGVAQKIALGSLYCRGISAFKYSGFDIPEDPDGDIFATWDGHAWIEFPCRYIGEPSLLRTARTAPTQSNLRLMLEAQGILQLDSLLMSEEQALSRGLKYERICYLPDGMIAPLIGGLIATQDTKA